MLPCGLLYAALAVPVGIADPLIGAVAMALFGVPVKEAAGFTLANHAVQMFPIIIAGLYSAVITGVKIRQFAGTKMEITNDAT